MSLTIKITGPDAGQSQVLKELSLEITLGDLLQLIRETVGLPANELRLRTGYPPKDVAIDNKNALITALGIQNGSVVSLLKKPSQDDIGDVKSQKTDSQATQTSNPLVSQLIDMGFSHNVAVKALEMAQNNLEAAFELCLGGLVTDDDFGSSPAVVASSTNGFSAPSAAFNSRVMIRRVIDADNSCLFNAIGYLMENDKKIGPRLRSLIAGVVRNRQDVYTEAMLGKPPQEYATYILNPNTWGGEIELLILSQYFATEIVAVEIRSQHLYIYGEDKNYSRRIYLLYDGVHYDALAAAASESAPESQDITQFPAGDESSREQVLALAAQLKQRRQFVDLVECSLRCMVCDKAFRGQDEALAHARVTKHTNFGEVGV